MTTVYKKNLADTVITTKDQKQIKLPFSLLQLHSNVFESFEVKKHEDKDLDLQFNFIAVDNFIKMLLSSDVKNIVNNIKDNRLLCEMTTFSFAYDFSIMTNILLSRVQVVMDSFKIPTNESAEGETIFDFCQPFLALAQVLQAKNDRESPQSQVCTLKSVAELFLRLITTAKKRKISYSSSSRLKCQSFSTKIFPESATLHQLKGVDENFWLAFIQCIQEGKFSFSF